MANNLFSLLGIILYFLVAWLFPWDEYQIEGSTISVSYFWDIIYFALVCFLFKRFPRFKLGKAILVRIPIIAFLGTLSVYLSFLFKLSAPFKYIENLVLQILILAPIIEEVVFRQAIYLLIMKLNLKNKFKYIIGSLCFSLSHFPALWYLPVEFHSFIYFQLIYTFILGWILIKARERSGSVIEPIILHFIFNFIFYFAVIKSWI